MAEEMKSSAPAKSGNDVVKGDFATILVGVGTMLDNTLTPLGKVVAQTLDSMTVVAKQILDGITASLNQKK
ncbi:MAG: hypothetical protein HGB29_03865 [Chlorobiaceae bacterium]|nr:hypothetical protein [Chlorobiaceae bacterium]NTW73979.1 hypothetical protein [Chlorobiaceae bacterium]